LAQEVRNIDPGHSEEDKGTHAAMILFRRDGVAQALGLPEGTKTMNLVYLPDRDAFCLVVEHPDLPCVHDGETLRQLVPTYRKLEITDLIDIAGLAPKSVPIKFVSWGL